MHRRLLLLLLSLAAVTSMTVTPAAHASPDDPISAADILQSGFNIKSWDHFGNPLKGTVLAES